jgi:hypothetical protein
MNRFEYLKAFNSPFKRPKLKWYFGEIAIGTPYFFPRRWVKPTQQMLIDEAQRDIADRKRWNEANEKYGNTPKVIPTIEELCEQKKNHKFPVPKRIGFDFVGLGWKTKWTDTDYRYEWSPIWSFVFFKWQIALMFLGPDSMSTSHYWEAWLYYHHNTKGTQRERIEQCKKDFPCGYSGSKGGEKYSVNSYDFILKDKYK